MLFVRCFKPWFVIAGLLASAPVIAAEPVDPPPRPLDPPLSPIDRHAPPAQFRQSPRASMRDLPFSEAVQAGDLLFLSGQVGVDEASGKLVPGGIVAEARQTLRLVKEALERNDASLSDVVKCTVFLADMAEWPKFNDVYREFFRKPYPARSALAANGLALGARVEVECIAYAPRTNDRLVPLGR